MFQRTESPREFTITNGQLPHKPANQYATSCLTSKFQQTTGEKKKIRFDLITFDFTVQIREELCRKSSQEASSCCQCQKQSELLGLPSRSRRSRGARQKFRPIFCLLDRVPNKHMTADPKVICQQTHSIPPAVWHRYLDRNTQTHIDTCTQSHTQRIYILIWICVGG